jgi:hypothetical protein
MRVLQQFKNGTPSKREAEDKEYKELIFKRFLTARPTTRL